MLSKQDALAAGLSNMDSMLLEVVQVCRRHFGSQQETSTGAAVGLALRHSLVSHSHEQHRVAAVMADNEALLLERQQLLNRHEQQQAAAEAAAAATMAQLQKNHTTLIATLSTELNTAEAERHQLRTEAQTFKQQAQHESQHASSLVQDLFKQRGRVNSQLDALQLQHQGLLQQRDTAAAQIAELQKKLAVATSAVAEHEALQQKLQIRVSQQDQELLQEHATATAQMTELRQQLTVATSAAAQHETLWQQHFDELRENNRLWQEQCTANHKAELQQQLSVAISTAAQRESLQVRDLSARCDELEEQLESTLATVSAQHATIASDCHRLRQQEHLKEQVAALAPQAEQLRALQQQHEQLLHDLGQQQEQVAALAPQAEEFRALQQLHQQMLQKLAQQQEQVAALAPQAEQLRALQQQHEQLLQDLGRQQEQVAALAPQAEQLKALQLKHQDTLAELRQLQLSQEQALPAQHSAGADLQEAYDLACEENDDLHDEVLQWYLCLRSCHV